MVVEKKTFFLGIFISKTFMFLTIVIDTVGVNKTDIRKKHLSVLILVFGDVLHTNKQFRDSYINNILTEESCINTQIFLTLRSVSRSMGLMMTL